MKNNLQKISNLFKDKLQYGGVCNLTKNLTKYKLQQTCESVKA